MDLKSEFHSLLSDMNEDINSFIESSQCDQETCDLVSNVSKKIFDTLSDITDLLAK